MQRPAGVTVISILFALAAVSLWTFASVKLVAPEAVSLMSASPLMYGLELAGPLMALLIGSVYGLISWGLLRLHNWARWAAMAVITVGVASLVPKISMAEIGVPVVGYGIQIAVRVAVGWYLAQAAAVIDAFAAKTPEL